MSTFDLGIALKRMFTNNFNRQINEKVLFLTDFAPPEYTIAPVRMEILNERAKFVELLYSLAKDIIGEKYATFKKYPATLQSGKEIPSEIAEELKNHDIFIAITTYSLSHTKARRDACSVGARGASMPGFTPDMFYDNRPMAVDHLKMRDFGEKLILEIEKARNINPKEPVLVKILDQKNNEFTFQILGSDRKLIRDFGLFINIGDFGNLPAGEVFTSIVEGTANGKIFIPKEWTKLASQDSDGIELEFKEGLLNSVKGAKNDFLETLGFSGVIDELPKEIIQTRRNAAEFGIGLNPNATQRDSVLEMEKTLGSIHIAIGTNDTFGGKVHSDIHIDFILAGASVYINNNALILNGIHTFQLDSPNS